MELARLCVLAERHFATLGVVSPADGRGFKDQARAQALSHI